MNQVILGFYLVNYQTAKDGWDFSYLVIKTGAKTIADSIELSQKLITSNK